MITSRAFTTACLFPLLTRWTSALTTEESGTNMKSMFDAWTIKHGKAYHLLAEVSDQTWKENDDAINDDDTRWKSEYEKRLAIFSDNYQRIQNMHGYDDKRTWHASFEGPFMDLHPEEFKQLHLGYKESSTSRTMRELSNLNFLESDEETGNKFVDWKREGAVTPVKNQAQCGSCWAFSATGAAEGAHYLATGELVSLSEQELVSCDSSDSGCGGGSMDNAFQFMISNGGLDTEGDYGYVSGAGDVPACNTKKEKESAVTIDKYEDVPTNEVSLRKAAAVQPIAVAVDASTWQFYGGGVFNGILGYCGTALNHGVLLSGFKMDTQNATDSYYVIKNSWGPDWGEDGYIRLPVNRGEYGMCGIAMAATRPLVSKKKESQQTYSANGHHHAV